MTDPISNDQLVYRLNSAETHISNLETEIKQLRKEIETAERRRLMYGIGALGAVISTLVGIIWSYRGVIFK